MEDKSRARLKPRREALGCLDRSSTGVEECRPTSPNDMPSGIRELKIEDPRSGSDSCSPHLGEETVGFKSRPVDTIPKELSVVFEEHPSKECNDCKEVKPLNCFNKREGVCKGCRRRMKERYALFLATQTPEAKDIERRLQAVEDQLADMRGGKDSAIAYFQQIAARAENTAHENAHNTRDIGTRLQKIESDLSIKNEDIQLQTAETKGGLEVRSLQSDVEKMKKDISLATESIASLSKSLSKLEVAHHHTMVDLGPRLVALERKSKSFEELHSSNSPTERSKRTRNVPR